jgi:hypothetical protein
MDELGEKIYTWMTAPTNEALKLQRPLPDDALMIVACMPRIRLSPLRRPIKTVSRRSSVFVHIEGE